MATSRAGLRLDPDAVLQGDLARVLEILQQRLAHYVQIESLTFSWMTCDQAQTIIRRVLADEFDHPTYGTVARNRVQTPDQHGRCHLCA